MTEHRDTTIAGALRRLDVPDHAPGFWDTLDARLAEPEPAAPSSNDGASVQGHAPDVVEIGSAPARRRTNGSRAVVLVLVAAVAAVIALVVGGNVVRPDDGAPSQVDTADPSPTTPPPESTRPPETTEPSTTEPGTPERPSVAAAEQRASEWLGLLREGETEVAYAMLDEASQAVMPLVDFEQAASGFAEGAGAFADLEPTSFGIARPDGTEATVVVFAGDVEREGMVETAGYPVVVTGAGDEPGIAFSFAGPPVELDEPAPGETRTSPVQVRVGSDQAWFSVDGGEAQPIGESPATIDVEGLAGGGTHVVTIIATDGELFTARSVTVVVP